MSKPDSSKPFIDHCALYPKGCIDIIQTKIHCVLVGEEGPPSWDSVTVYTPQSSRNKKRIDNKEIKDGTYTALISAGDCNAFEEFGACVVGLSTSRGEHTLLMTFDETTDTCSIFDPNGSIADTYATIDPSELKGLCKAIHMGLLRALVSRKGNSTVFNISFQAPTSGLQTHEKKTAVMFRRYHATALTVAQMHDFNESFLNTNGFCNSWSLFRFVDHIYNKQKLYNFVEDIFLRLQPLYWFGDTAEKIFYNQFVKDMSQKGLEHDLVTFKELLPCIFIRLLATYFVLQSDKGEFVASTFIGPILEGDTSQDISFKWPSIHGGDLDAKCDALTQLMITLHQSAMSACGSIMFTKQWWHGASEIDLVKSDETLKFGLSGNTEPGNPLFAKYEFSVTPDEPFDEFVFQSST